MNKLKSIWQIEDPSNVTWLSAKETTKRTGVILCVVAASAAFMMLADTLFGAMLRFAI